MVNEMDNDLLTLWLKAKDGLSCDEARDLIDRLRQAERDHAEDIAGLEKEHEKALEEAYDEIRALENGA